MHYSQSGCMCWVMTCTCNGGGDPLHQSQLYHVLLHVLQHEQYIHVCTPVHVAQPHLPIYNVRFPCRALTKWTQNIKKILCKMNLSNIHIHNTNTHTQHNIHITQHTHNTFIHKCAHTAEQTKVQVKRQEREREDEAQSL